VEVGVEACLAAEVDVAEEAVEVEEVLWMRVRPLRYVRPVPFFIAQKEKWSSS